MLLLIGSPLFLDASGFCSSEMRWLSKREVVDRLLFGENAPLMSFDEKVQAMKERDGSEYPNNCRVAVVSNSLYSLRYEIECVHPRMGRHDPAPKSSSRPYDYKMYSVDACGKNLDFIGEGIPRLSKYDI